MNNISAELVVLIAMFLSMLAFFMNLTKKTDNISKELSDFKDEMRKDLNELKIENQKEHFTLQKQMLQFESRFDKHDGVHTDIEARLAEIQAQSMQTKEQVTANQNQTNEKLLQMETDNKNYMKELTNKVIEILPKSAL